MIQKWKWFEYSQWKMNLCVYKPLRLLRTANAWATERENITYYQSMKWEVFGGKCHSLHPNRWTTTIAELDSRINEVETWSSAQKAQLSLFFQISRFIHMSWWVIWSFNYITTKMGPATKQSKITMCIENRFLNQVFFVMPDKNRGQSVLVSKINPVFH